MGAGAPSLTGPGRRYARRCRPAPRTAARDHGRHRGRRPGPPVQRDGAGRPTVRAQRQHQAAAESSLSRRRVRSEIRSASARVTVTIGGLPDPAALTSYSAPPGRDASSDCARAMEAESRAAKPARRGFGRVTAGYRRSAWAARLSKPVEPGHKRRAVVAGSLRVRNGLETCQGPSRATAARRTAFPR